LVYAGVVREAVAKTSVAAGGETWSGVEEEKVRTNLRNGDKFVIT
jgi:hypothetical protein